MASGVEAAKREVNLVDVCEMLGKLNDHADKLLGKGSRLQDHVLGPAPTGECSAKQPPSSGLVAQLSDRCSDLSAKLHGIEDYLNVVSSRLGVPPNPSQAGDGPVRLARG